MFNRKNKGPEPVAPANLFTVNEPSSVIAEQVKTIRTNVSFAQQAQSLRTIMVTSAMASEGKSIVTANLAVEFAQAGKRVVLIDADLRRSTVNRTFRIREVNRGLTNYLVRQIDDITEVCHPTMVENLAVIPSGPTPPNPAELIGSPLMATVFDQLKQYFDLIIVDAPPILPVTDGQILSNMVDGVILVVRQNYTDKRAVVDTKERLEQAQANILGVVLNDVRSEGHSGYYNNGDGYYGYEYSEKK
ncbi:cps2B protein [Lapidilactobacillus concavus DSM 17758]|uniref:Tyrosine-protein kinase CpsD n=1 Tax=Lapidilactobacillus concavus DSM 17758 TaxID=1423735 RepID=A0A0R1VQ95_9LACO|nr:CpsD/CapB family tyrosine-protein kinase [Lapidilactobacillus concavus]KRM07778.1 cps2B protein [Lapidilactobacillus concavus DSM 17758]GEL13701.1 exopolysaccharide biosynthesis protein [Lapidilactobacillus concavus]